jgi:hypothetical protein
MRTIIIAAVGLVAAATSAAQTPTGSGPACGLLTASELAVVGGTGRGQAHQMAVNEGLSKGHTMDMCTWAAGEGRVSVMVVPVPPGTVRDLQSVRTQELARLDKQFEPFKAKGWKRERKEFGDTMCEVYVPPPAVKDELITTGCFTARKDTAVSVAAQSKTAVPVENVRTLIDKASGRLR